MPKLRAHRGRARIYRNRLAGSPVEQRRGMMHLRHAFRPGRISSLIGGRTACVAPWIARNLFGLRADLDRAHGKQRERAAHYADQMILRVPAGT